MFYTEDDIDKLIQPIIDRQIEVNNYIIKLIAQRIKEIGELLPSDIFSLEQLAKTGADVRMINTRLAQVAKLQVADIKQVIKRAASNVYQSAKPFFDYRKKPYIPFKENEQVQRVVKSIEKQTSGTYQNMAKAQAFMTRDPANPKILIPTTPARTYQNTVDKAIQTVQSGAKDYQSTMRNTLKEIVDSGIKEVVYEAESGRVHTQRMDTAVRRNLLDGVRAVNQGVQDEVGKQFGADGVEITVHACPAPDHCFVQGHQFSMSEYAKIAPMGTIQADGSIDNSVYDNQADKVYDVNGKAYDVFDRKIGTLNCRHFAFNIIIGHAPQNYTDEQLQDILDENEQGVTVDGKKYTKYQATQIQRKMETKIRKAKDEQIAMKELGNMDGVREAQDKVTKYTQEYKDFSDKAGLRMKLDRIKVEGYKKVKF